MEFQDKCIRDKCGVVGIFSKNPVDITMVMEKALSSMQHRGKESCGLAYLEENKIISIKSMGKVEKLFSNLNSIYASLSIGHLRYSTQGSSHIVNAQPLVNSKNPYIALAHNGQITNYYELKEKFRCKGLTFETSTDTEILLNIMLSSKKTNIEEMLLDSLRNIKGSYSFTMIFKDSLIGIRDPKGIRPLCIGKLQDAFIIASESCALDSLGAEFLRDVEPGEAVIINNEGIKSIYFSKGNHNICAFEYVYFSHCNSILDGLEAKEARKSFGKELYKEFPIKADIVSDIPNSGFWAAKGYAEASNIPYQCIFRINNQIGRTFIHPKGEERTIEVKKKFSISEEVKGKDVILIDDSIVRGNTSKVIVEELRKKGANKIYFLSAAPPVKYPCKLGIDIPTYEELLAYKRSDEEIRKYINADEVHYISLKGFLKVINQGIKPCIACFAGVY